MNRLSLTNSVSEAMIQIFSDIEHVPSASALRARILSERQAWENWEGIIFGRNVVLGGMRKIETKEIFYQVNWSLLCRPWKKGRRSPANYHQVVGFQVYLISKTLHPWLDLGGNEKWKGGRCSWQGGESRCALGRRGDHKYQRCLALRFARTI